MPNWEKNPYSKPQNVGLEIVGELDEGEPYSFNMVVVWKNKKGKLFYAADSGCSCPSPFEDYEGEETLTKLTKENLDEFEKTVRKLRVSTDKQNDFIFQVKLYFNQQSHVRTKLKIPKSK